jgi:exodeoxyribonuclease VII large subunit
VAKVEPIMYGDRKVYTVAAFNRGVAQWLRKLPTVWVEGEVTELRRNDAWATVFLTLKDRETGAVLSATILRRTFDRLELALSEGETVHVHGRAELYEAKGELVLRADRIERLGVGDHLLALERLKQKLAAEGLFAAERKRPLPRIPRAIGILTGADAAARGDLVRTIADRFPAATVVVCETRVQGRGAPERIVAALQALEGRADVDVIVLARGGGSLEDLLPFSDETVVRAVAACRVPVVSAVGHEQDTPLVDLAADVRAATPTAAGVLVVPAAEELRSALDERLERMAAATRRIVARSRERLERLRERLLGAPRTLLERRRATVDRAGARLHALSPLATLERGYAIVRHEGVAVRDAGLVPVGAEVDAQLVRGALRARVEGVRA